MVLTLQDTELQVYAPGADDPENDDPVAVIDGTDLTNIENTSFSITERIQQGKDSATFHFDNSNAQYTDTVISGHKLVFESYHGADQTTTEAQYGEFKHGEATWGGGVDVPVARRWTGMARSPSYSHFGAEFAGVTFDAPDFVNQIMSDRRVYLAFPEIPIHEIIEDIVSIHAPEIDTTFVSEDVNRLYDAEFNGKDLLECMRELCEVGDAIFYSRGDELHVEPLESIRSEFKLTYDDISLADLDVDDRELTNDVRIDGARGHALDEHTIEPDTGEPDGTDPATQIFGYQTVTDTNRLHYELTPEKTSLDRISVWTKAGDNEEDLRIRIQGANAGNTGPKNPDNDRLDVVGDRTSHEFISHDGWRDRFRLQRETLPPNPWLIIESSGENGHEIGLNENSDPAIKTFYPFPVFVRQTNIDSVLKYRRRQTRDKKESIASFESADKLARARLRRYGTPEKTIAFEAMSFRAHQLLPGHMIEIDMPEIAATGNYLIVERSDDYDSVHNRLRSNYTAQELDPIIQEIENEF